MWHIKIIGRHREYSLRHYQPLTSVAFGAASFPLATSATLQSLYAVSTHFACNMDGTPLSLRSRPLKRARLSAASPQNLHYPIPVISSGVDMPYGSTAKNRYRYDEPRNLSWA